MQRVNNKTTVPPAARILIEEREVRECLLAGRCVPKLEKPIIERIMESESESDIFGGGCGGIYCNVKNIGRGRETDRRC
jgi:hypothetical protein